MARIAGRMLILFLGIVILSINPMSSMASGRKLHLVTSFYPMYIMALNVLKDVPGVDLVNLAPSATGCLHDYNLTASDMRKLEKADILIANGAGMESFLFRIAESYPKLMIAELSQGIPLIKRGKTLNPHVWVSITDAIAEVKNLADFLAAKDPGHADLYRKNGQEYGKRLDALRREMHARLEKYRGTPIITFHEAFPYFAREFGLNVVGVIDREPGSVPSAKDMADTIGMIKNLHVHALFAEPQYSPAAAEIIAREAGISLHHLDPAVSGDYAPDAYIKIMLRNLESLEDALR